MLSAPSPGGQWRILAGLLDWGVGDAACGPRFSGSDPENYLFPQGSRCLQHFVFLDYANTWFNICVSCLILNEMS